jgi:hypothetical protein
MTDKNASNMSTDARPGMRVLYVSLPITKEQLLLRGEWTDKVPVAKTANYVETEKNYMDTPEKIDIPGLPAKK